MKIHKAGYSPFPPRQKEKAETIEQFLKSMKRFSDKNCGKIKKIEQLVEPSETKNALSQHDYLLWERVAATVRPLSAKGRRHYPQGLLLPIDTAAIGKNAGAFSKKVNEKIEINTFSEKKTTKQETRVTQPVKQHENYAHSVPSIETKERRKIARGQLKIGARLDLHGLDSASAYDLLLHFIARSAKEGKKHVLVITGKGSSAKGRNDTIWQNGRQYERGEVGILRQSVPAWLATAPFRLYVSGIEEAERHHGGSGALYVRLRHHRKGSS